MKRWLRLCSPLFAYARSSPDRSFIGSEIIGRESHWNSELQVVLALRWCGVTGEWHRRFPSQCGVIGKWYGNLIGSGGIVGVRWHALNHY